MSTISNLIFYKINNKTCNIVERTQAFDNYPNEDLQFEYNNLLLTGLIFLNEILEYNDELEGFRNSIEKDIMEPLKEGKNDEAIKNSEKYIEKILFVEFQDNFISKSQLIEMNISESIQDEIFNYITTTSNENDYFYENEIYWSFKTLRHLELLEKYFSEEQISELWPRLKMRIILKENLFENIDDLKSAETTLDSHCLKWLF